MPTLCLNMIVKNEGKIIHRLLESVYRLIDSYCICDTGSTDNTCEIIKEFMEEKNIPGKIVKEPFINFEYNRTFALQQCYELKDTLANYILLLDADMILQVNKVFNKSILDSGDIFYLLQGNNDYYYNNIRIIKNTEDLKYVGVTHEFLSYPNSLNKKIHVSKDILFILDIGDGGSKSDKFERDIRLLNEALVKDPNNGRYLFYLGNSYKNLGLYNEAIDTYTKKINLNGQWCEEVWQSYYMMGKCYMELNKPELAIKFWNKCLEVQPRRIENLYKIVNYYRNNGREFAKDALKDYNKAVDILNKKYERDGFLFLENSIYEWELYFEYTIFAFYADIKNISKEAMIVFNKCNQYSKINNLLGNYHYYDILLPAEKTHNISSTFIYKNNIPMVSSSCSIIPAPFNGYLCNVRYVNYKINQSTGEYINCKNIITVNKAVELNSDFEIINEHILYPKYEERLYIGIEDIKIFNYKGRICSTGTGYHKNEKIGIFISDDYYNMNNYKEIKQSFKTTTCEKNWVYVNINNELKMIYQWNPLIICDIPKANVEPFELTINTTNSEMPGVFNWCRGSTNGFNYGGEIWFIQHLVHYSNPRIYYNIISVFDNNMKLLKYTTVFKLSKEKIEYCLGLIVNDANVIISYSEWDSTSKIGIYNKQEIEKLFIYC